MRNLVISAAAAVFPLIPSVAAAQESAEMATNAVYVELGGNAPLYSINYERRLSDGFAARIGAMYIGAEGEDESTGESVNVDLTLVPVMANFLLGDGSGRLELGIGPLFAFGSKSRTTWMARRPT